MEEKNHISLSQLQGQIKASLNASFPFPVWVTAEISELKINRSSGHCYMELIEKGGSNAVPKAKATAAVWRNTFNSISSHFRSQTGDELSAGMNVMLKVGVNYHELYGISLVVSDINPSFTLGDTAAQRAKTIARLKADGIFDMNKELEFPLPTQNIAVISSPTAAGYRDFYKELSLSPYAVNITLFDALMQGVGAEQSIIDALDRIAEMQDDFDAVVLIRGGGSQSDLACFNSYELCSVLAQFPLPIIAGIGHDKDVSVADEVACLSLKTPTAVAGYLLDAISEQDYEINNLLAMIHDRAKGILQFHTSKLEGQIFQVSRISSKLTQNLEMSLQTLQDSIMHSSKMLIIKNKAKIERFETQLEGLKPEKILARGYSIVQCKGKSISDSAQLSEGDKIEVIMSKGKISAQVIK